MSDGSGGPSCVGTPPGSWRLAVRQADQVDVGRWLARLNQADMSRLGLADDQVVMLTGGRSTTIEVRAGGSCAPGQIALDGLTRANAQVLLGEPVVGSTCLSHPAASVLLGFTGNSLSLASAPGGERIKKDWLLGRVLSLDDVVGINQGGARIAECRVMGTAPDGPVRIVDDTKVEIVEDEAAVRRLRAGSGPGSDAAAAGGRWAYEDVGGLGEQVGRIREMVEAPLHYPWVYTGLGIRPPKGILLCGPPGCGKTLIARVLSCEVRAHFIHVDGPEVMHKYYGESEAYLRSVFEEAGKKAPSIVFLDELDAIAPKRSAVAGEVEKRVVAQLLALMDGLASHRQVIVLGATNMPELLDPALRRPGRFDAEIQLGAPDAGGRLEIFRIHSRGLDLSREVSLPSLADATGGFVGADLEALCREAALSALRRVIGAARAEGRGFGPYAFGPFGETDVVISPADFAEAFRRVSPATYRGTAVQKVTAGLDSVVGLSSTRQLLMAAVGAGRRALKAPGPQWTASNSKYAAPRSILLYGPPGVGKTLLVRAVAGETGTNLLELVPANLFSRWVGESERSLGDLFRTARQSVPCFLFLDHLEVLAPAAEISQDAHLTRRLVAQLKHEMEQAAKVDGLYVLAATSRPGLVDKGVWSGFEVRLEVPLPDLCERRLLLRHFLGAMSVEVRADLDLVAERTAGMTPGELLELCRRAYLFVSATEEPATRCPVIEQIHFVQALATNPN